MTTIYKISGYVRWDAKGDVITGSKGGGSYTPPVVSSGLDGAGAAGRVAYWLDENTLTNDDNLTYEVDSAGRGTLSVPNILGIGDSAGENTELRLWGDIIYLSASSWDANSVIMLADNSMLSPGAQNLVFIQTPLATVNNPRGSALNIVASDGYTGGGGNCGGGSLSLYSGNSYGADEGGHIGISAGYGHDSGGAGGSISIHAGDGSSDNPVGIGPGGQVEIISGTASNGLAGDILIQTGKNLTNNVYGHIYLGNGSSYGVLPAKSSETNVVYYDPATGKLSYGAGGGSGDSLWEEDSNGDLVPISVGKDVRTHGDSYANDFILIP
jgi:hypothetical protein